MVSCFVRSNGGCADINLASTELAAQVSQLVSDVAQTSAKQ